MVILLSLKLLVRIKHDVTQKLMLPLTIKTLFASASSSPPSTPYSNLPLRSRTTPQTPTSPALTIDNRRMLRELVEVDAIAGENY